MVGIPQTVAIDRRVQSGQQHPQSRQTARTTGATSPAQLASEVPEKSPAFPGAHHDAEGFCVRHSKVRLANPVGEKEGGESSFAIW